MRTKTCSVPTCDRDARVRGWCKTHYNRWKRHGDVRPDVPLRQPKPDHCTVDGCYRPVARKGLCWTHAKRLKKYGDVQAHIPIRVWVPQSEQEAPARLDREAVRRSYEDAIDVWRLGSPAWEACHRLGVRPRRVSAWAYDHLPDTDPDKGEVVAAFYAAHHYMPEETDD
jgi:hypothetical protein